MNKSEIVLKVAEAAGCTKAAAGRAVDCVFECMEESVAKDGRFAILGFGAFKVKDAPARKVHSIRGGGEVEIPARKRVSFTAGAKLKQRLNP